MWRIALIIGLSLLRKGKSNGSTPNSQNPPTSGNVDTTLAATLIVGILNNFDSLIPPLGSPNRCTVLEQLYGANDATFIKVLTDYKNQKGKTLEAAIIEIEKVKEGLTNNRFFCPNQTTIWQDKVIERMQQLGLT